MKHLTDTAIKNEMEKQTENENFILEFNQPIKLRPKKKIKKNKTFQQKKQFWNNDIYKLRNIL